MPWHITGTYYAPCSCKVGCPCTLGELEGDQGWCSGGQTYEIRSGNVDGVDLGGAKFTWNADWPSGFLAGNGVGRFYFDPSLSPQQRDAITTVIGGRRGGVFEAVAALVPKFLPPKEAPITIQTGDAETRIKVGDVGELVVTPLRGPSGQVTRLLHAAAAFRDDIVLARGTGSHWRDPDMRSWDSLGHAEQTDFDWSGN